MNGDEPEYDTPTIRSPFFSFQDSHALPWNHRLLLPPTGVARAMLSERSERAVSVMKEALAQGTLEVAKNETCVCGSKTYDRLSAYDRFGLPFATVVCRRCGLVRLVPHIAESSLRDYYERFYHMLHFGAAISEHPALYQTGQGSKIHRLLSPFLNGRQTMRVLEIGVGTGSVLKEFVAAAEAAGQEVDALGTEFSHECIALAAKQGVRVQYGGFDEVLAGRARFDVVILSHVIEHFIGLTDELAKLREVMAPGACVYVEVPGIMSIHNRAMYAFDFSRYVTHAHIYHFNLTSPFGVFNIKSMCNPKFTVDVTPFFAFFV